MTPQPAAPAAIAVASLSPAMRVTLRQLWGDGSPSPAALWPARTLAALRRRGLVRRFTYVAGGSAYVRVTAAGRDAGRRLVAGALQERER